MGVCIRWQDRGKRGGAEGGRGERVEDGGRGRGVRYGKFRGEGGEGEEGRSCVIS